MEKVTFTLDVQSVDTLSNILLEYYQKEKQEKRPSNYLNYLFEIYKTIENEYQKTEYAKTQKELFKRD